MYNDDDIWPWIIAIVAVIVCIVIFIWLHQTFPHQGHVITAKIDAVSTHQSYNYHTYTTSDCDGYDAKGRCTGYITHFHSYWSWDNDYELHNTLFDRSNPALGCTYNAQTDDRTTRWLPCQVYHYLQIAFDEKSPWCDYNNDRWNYVELKSEMDILENRLGQISCK